MAGTPARFTPEHWPIIVSVIRRELGPERATLAEAMASEGTTTGVRVRLLRHGARETHDLLLLKALDKALGELR